MKAIPASHATSLPNGSAFSISTKIASAAIQKRVITPPTKSNSIKAQHQPIQDTLVQPQPISASEYSKPSGMSLRTHRIPDRFAASLGDARPLRASTSTSKSTEAKMRSCSVLKVAEKT